MLSDCFVSVVAPLYNQARIIESFTDDLLAVLQHTYTNFEVLLIDDGSTDTTPTLVSQLLKRHPFIRYIRLSRHFGQEVAISAGLDSVIGDYVVVMLPETDPPDLIPTIVDMARKESAIVHGVRRKRSDEPFWISLGASLFYWYCDRVLQLNLPRNSTTYCVLNRQAVNAIIRIKDSSRYLRVFSGYVGFSRQSFVYDELRRGGGPAPRRLLPSLNLAIDIIVTNSTHPLRFVSLLGVFASMLNLLYMLYVVAIFLYRRDVAEGWTTTSLQNAGMFFFLCLILAVISEYIGRILAEARDRPLYYVLEEHNSSMMVEDQDRRNVVRESLYVDTDQIR